MSQEAYLTWGNDDRDCYKLPVWVSNIPHLTFFVFQLQLLVIYCVNQLLHHLLFKHVGLPPLVSQLCSGFILGPSGLGRIKQFQHALFPHLNIALMKSLTIVTYMLSLFIIATQMDFTIIKRTGKKTIIIGLVSLFSALGANNAALKIFKPAPKYMDDLRIASASFPVTSHPVLVRLITDIGLANSELGRLALAAGLAVECASILVTLIINNILLNVGDTSALLLAIWNVVGVVLLLLIIVYALRPMLRFLIRITPKDRPIKDTYVLIAFLSMLIGALFTEGVGQYVLLGAFMVGGGLPDGPPLGSAIVDKFDALVTGILTPFFITISVSRVDLSKIDVKGEFFHAMIMLMAVNTVTKIIVIFFCGVYTKVARRDALSFGSLMCCKGFLELATLSWLLDFGNISEVCFSLMVLHILLMSIFVPFAIKLLYDPMRKYGGYQIRDIFHLKPNASLRMVACVLKTDNITSITNLLRSLNPTREAPIEAHIIHLMKLAGRCQPLFISHDMQKKQSSSRSYSDELIWHFERLQHQSMGVLTTHVFTALAHPEAMHEYICTLALDKLTSLIVLPFHRKFSVEGSVTADDHHQRVLNTSVLTRSPCSVAVLVDRAQVNLRQQGQRRAAAAAITVVTAPAAPEELQSVAVIFIGGSDDREALSFAQRMSRGGRISLTVIRLAAPNDGEEFFNSIDSKALDKVVGTKLNVNEGHHQQVTYLQVTVKDGIEAALKLRSMIQDYNLILVGRRFNLNSPQTAGLSDSSEIKELGILGDLFASPDIKCETSVLVVQQQQHWT